MKPRHGFVDVRPLRTNPAFRRLWAGNGLSTMGAQFTMVAVLYQVWQLTGSPAAVGIIGIFQAVPSIGFGLVGGSLADAYDRRKIVVAVRFCQIAVATLLAAQALAGIGSLWLLLALVFCQEACGGLAAPSSRTFAVRLLPAAQVSAGITLNHLNFQVALLAGPAVAGVVAGEWGTGVCYVLDAASYCAALYSVLRLPSLRPTGATTKPGLRGMAAGFRFIAGDTVVRGAFLVDLMATVLAMPVALFPVVNAVRFGGSPETLGLFLTAIGVGGVLAGTFSGFLTRARRQAPAMLVAAMVWGAGMAGFGLAGSLWLTLGCLAVAGAADVVSVVTRGSIVQLATPDSYRGRISAVERIVGKSGPEVGNFRAGMLAEATSASLAAVSGGLACVVGCAIVAARNGPLRRFTIPGGDGSTATQPATSVSSAE